MSLHRCVVCGYPFRVRSLVPYCRDPPPGRACCIVCDVEEAIFGLGASEVVSAEGFESFKKAAAEYARELRELVKEKDTV